MKFKRHVVSCPRCDGYALVPQGCIRKEGIFVPCRECGDIIYITKDTPKINKYIDIDNDDTLPISIQEILIGDKIVSFKFPEKFAVERDKDKLVSVNDFWGLTISSDSRRDLEKKIVHSLGHIIDEYIFSSEPMSKDAKVYSEKIKNRISSIS